MEHSSAIARSDSRTSRPYVDTVLHHSGPDLGSLGVKGDGQRPAGAGCETSRTLSVHPAASNRLPSPWCKLTSDGLPSVVNDTLVVLVRSVRKVHSNYREKSAKVDREFSLMTRSDRFSRHPLDLPMFIPASARALRASTVLVLGPMVAMMEV